MFISLFDMAWGLLLLLWGPARTHATEKFWPHAFFILRLGFRRAGCFRAFPVGCTHPMFGRPAETRFGPSVKWVLDKKHGAISCIWAETILDSSAQRAGRTPPSAGPQYRYAQSGTSRASGSPLPRKPSYLLTPLCGSLRSPLPKTAGLRTNKAPAAKNCKTQSPPIPPPCTDAHPSAGTGYSAPSSRTPCTPAHSYRNRHSSTPTNPPRPSPRYSPNCPPAPSAR